MKVFLAALAFAAVAAVGVAMVLNTIQQPSSVAFSTSGARVGDPGHNLIGAGLIAGGERARRHRWHGRSKSGSRRTAARCMSPLTTAQMFDLSAELLRVTSPSAEVQGHSEARAQDGWRQAQRDHSFRRFRRQLCRQARVRRHALNRHLLLGVSARSRRQRRAALSGLSRRPPGQRPRPRQTGRALTPEVRCECSRALDGDTNGRNDRRQCPDPSRKSVSHC